MAVATMLRGGARHEVLGVAREMDPAALPGGAQQLLVDRPHEPAVIVADDQPDAAQATLDEAADEGRPGGALVVARRELEAQHAPLAAGGHARRDQRRHGDHAARLAHLDVRRVEPQVRDTPDRRAGGRGTSRPRRRARRRSG